MNKNAHKISEKHKTIPRFFSIHFKNKHQRERERERKMNVFKTKKLRKIEEKKKTHGNGKKSHLNAFNDSSNDVHSFNFFFQVNYFVFNWIKII